MPALCGCIGGRRGRAVAPLAGGAARGGRRPADQQRGRRDQLRHARARPPDARLRPRPARRPRDPGAPRASPRGHPYPRRPGAATRPGDTGDRRRRPAAGTGRGHGRRRLGGRRRNRGHRPGSGVLQPDLGPAHQQAARSRNRRVVSVRTRRGCRGPGERDGASAPAPRGNRGGAAPRTDHRPLPEAPGADRRAPAPPPHRPPAGTSGRRGVRDADAVTPRVRPPAGADGRGAGVARNGTDVPGRRQPRRGSDRGDRAAPRLRPASDHIPGADRATAPARALAGP